MRPSADHNKTGVATAGFSPERCFSRPRALGSARERSRVMPIGRSTTWLRRATPKPQGSSMLDRGAIRRCWRRGGGFFQLCFRGPSRPRDSAEAAESFYELLGGGQRRKRLPRPRWPAPTDRRKLADEGRAEIVLVAVQLWRADSGEPLQAHSATAAAFGRASRWLSYHPP